MNRGIAVVAALMLVLGTGAMAAAQDGYQDYEDDRQQEPERDYGNSSFEMQGDTLVGDHVAFTVDEDRPGVTGYRILDGNVTVFASVTLPGDGARWTLHEDRFMMDTPEANLVIRDHESYRVAVDVDSGGEAALDVADGVDVTENETWSDADGERVYDLSAGAHDTKVGGDDLTYDGDVLGGSDDVMHGADFPGEPDDDHRERPPPEERRESQWERDGDAFEGEHVRFTKDEALPGVTALGPTDPDVAVVAEIDLPGDAPDWHAHGRIFAMRTAEAELRVVDVPPAVMNLDAREGGTASITLAEGVTAEEVPVEDEDAPENASMYRLHLPGNRTAWLGGSDAVLHEADPANGTQAELVVDGRAMARLAPGDDPRHGGPDEDPGPEDQERRGPPEDAEAAAELDRESRRQVERAAASGKVGVEVHPDGGEATAVEMGHVTVREAQGPEGDVKAGVTVEAPDDAPGTVVRFALNASALEGIDVTEVPDALTVRYDNETIEAADDLEDALDWSDDGGEPEYLLLVGGEEVEVLVSVPHFSPHTIEVVETASSGSKAIEDIPGPGVLAALLAGLGAAAVRRR